MLQFAILGPIEVRRDNAVAVTVKGVLQRTLLAALLVRAGTFLSAHSLILELWGEQPPVGAENALQAHISRLRRKLDALRSGERIQRLVTWPSNYRLVVGSDELDAGLFSRTLDAARARRDSDPAGTSRQLREALTYWRGTALDGLHGGPICQAAAQRYEESRREALDLLYDTEMRMGRHVEVIPELTLLTEAEPYNERLCERLMVALYRSGRQADALAAYRRLRSRLADHVGIEPSPNLQLRERAILSHDPALWDAVEPAAA